MVIQEFWCKWEQNCRGWLACFEPRAEAFLYFLTLITTERDGYYF